MDVKKAMTSVYGNPLWAAAADRLAELGLRMRLRNLIRDIDFSRRAWLRRVGLQPYSPMRGTVGTGILLVAGAVVGAAAGMVLAPMRGQQFRQEIRQRAMAMMARQRLSGTQQPAQA